MRMEIEVMQNVICKFVISHYLDHCLYCLGTILPFQMAFSTLLSNVTSKPTPKAVAQLLKTTT